MNRTSLKENLKIAAVLVSIFLAIAIPVTIAYLSLPIESPPVTVTVHDASDYTLTISVTPSEGTIYDTYTFIGTLTLNENGNPVPGKLVTLLVDDGTGTDFTPTGLSDTTSTEGSYSINWTPITHGTFTFKTVAEI